MNASTGKFCAYCKAEIQGGERIIVCPSCLAIHHENCWNEHKGCSASGCIYHYQEVPTTPAEPIAPTAPIEAFAPLAPVEPVAPAAPAEPVAPAAPVEPVAPLAPVEPIAPLAPVEPVAPAAPIEAFAPLAPVEPVAPAAPAEPAAPAAPIEAFAPLAPVEPLAPAAPVKAFAPLAPVEPVAPEAAIESVAPEAPIEAFAPAAPIEAFAPAAPIEPVAPAAPAEPFAPAIPVKPTAPAASAVPFATAAPVEPSTNAAIEQFNSNIDNKKKKSKNKFIIPAAIGTAIALLIILIAVFSGPPIDSITLSDSDLEILVDETANVTYTIEPAESQNEVEVSWTSSDPSVAIVNDIGTITAVGEGTCTITVTAKGKTDFLNIVVITGPIVDSITLSDSEVKLLVGKTTSTTYTIAPAESQNEAEVIWTSSDTSVATVSSTGIITAVGEGTCTITATAKDKSDTLTVVVVNGPDFNEIYNQYCEYTWAEVAYDGSWLDIDTNPYNWEDDGVAYLDAYYAVENIIEALGLPSSLFDDIGETSYNDGRQTRYYETVTVTWTYHPDQGLEITFKHP